MTWEIAVVMKAVVKSRVLSSDPGKAAAIWSNVSIANGWLPLWEQVFDRDLGVRSGLNSEIIYRADTTSPSRGRPECAAWAAAK